MKGTRKGKEREGIEREVRTDKTMQKDSGFFFKSFWACLVNLTPVNC